MQWHGDHFWPCKDAARTGTKDFLPEDMRVRSWLFGLWSRVSEQFGFEMVEGPVLESEELFTRKAGEEIVEQLYNFEVGRGSRRADVSTCTLGQPRPSAAWVAS